MNNPYHDGIFIYDTVRDKISVVKAVIMLNTPLIPADVVYKALVFENEGVTSYMPLERLIELYRPLGTHSEVIRLLYGK